VEVVRSSGKRLGFTPGGGPDGIVVLAVTPDRPAERAGLRTGDRVLAVDGVAIRRLLEYEQVARGFERGRPVPFTIQREGKVLEIPVVPGVPQRWGLFLVNVLTVLGYLAVALLAFPQAGSDLRARLLVAFAAAVSIEIALPVNIIGRPWVEIGMFSAFYLLTGLEISVELHLASLIPDRPPWLRRRPWVVPLYYAIGLGLGVASCATYLTEEILPQPFFPWNSQQADALLLGFGLPFWALGVTILLARQALRHPEPRGRHQAWLVLAGTIPWLLFVVASTVVERLGLVMPPWATEIESLVLLCYPVAFFIAIYRYHLFDIELVVRRGLIYTTLTGALVLVFYAALGAGGALFSHLVEEGESVWAVSAATLLLGLLFSPLRRALHRLIDQRFFPERYALRQRLIALAGELPALGKLPRMGRHLVGRLVEIFRSRSATLLIADPETGLLGILAGTGAPVTAEPPAGAAPFLLPLDDPAVDHLRRAQRPLSGAQLAARGPAFALRFQGLDPAGVAVPLLNQERLIGALILGRKEGSRAYPAEELDLLNLLAHHVATVFENARLFESATYESLTGLLRREAILEQLGKELERAARYGRPLTIAMADLDYFKEVNDRYGHLAGDTLLKRVSQVVSEGLRSTDWIGRYGGEEFLLVLPETDMAGAAAVAEKIRALVQRTVVPMEDGAPARVTISIGLATLEDVTLQQGRARARDLIAAADRSLYEAKNGGRNRVYPKVA
jgi:diguanylate cyclase (GGDEF)-like protein